MNPFRKTAQERSATDARKRRQVERMRGVSSTVNRGHAIPDAPAPYTCGARCGHPAGDTCRSTVRGGVCPCRFC